MSDKAKGLTFRAWLESRRPEWWTGVLYPLLAQAETHGGSPGARRFHQVNETTYAFGSDEVDFGRKVDRNLAFAFLVYRHQGGTDDPSAVGIVEDAELAAERAELGL